MWAVMVEVVAPCRHQIAGMAQAVEQVLVQQFVPHSTVEALNEAVLRGLAWRGVVPLHLPVLLPLQDGIGGQFGPVVADHHAGVAPNLGDPVQFAANPET